MVYDTTFVDLEISRDIGAMADPDYHCGKHGIDPEFELTEDCLLCISFTAPEYFGKIMRATGFHPVWITV